MMNCLKCNSAILANGKFCMNCGTPVQTENKCVFCQTVNPVGMSFCAGCGKPQNSTTPNTPNNSALNNNPVDFAYLLSEEKILSGEVGSAVKVPYGSVAVTLVDGEVLKVQEEDAKNSKTSAIGDFFKSIGNFWNELTGQQKVKARTYVLMNLVDLPILNYSHPFPLPGIQNGTLKFNFWVDANSKSDHKALGIFFQKTMGNLNRLSLSDLRHIAVSKIPELINNLSPDNLKTEDYCQKLSEMLRNLTGVSSKCSYTRGKNSHRRHLELSKVQKPVACTQCGNQYTEKFKFCESCGFDLSKLDWIGSSSFLTTASGEQLTIRVTMNEDEQSHQTNPVDDAQITEKIMSYISPILRKRDLASLMTSSALISLSQQLNEQLSKDFQGYLTDFQVIDIRTVDEDWFFKTEALIREELRRIKSDTKFLDVKESEIDYEELAFALELRKINQNDSHELVKRRTELENELQRRKLELDAEVQVKKVDLDSKVQNLELDVTEFELDTKTDLKKENITDQAEQERLNLQTAKLLRESDFNRTQTQISREDEIGSVTHEMGLEKTVLKHDIELADLTGDAQSKAKRREVTDKSFAEEEAIRLEALKDSKAADLEDRQTQRQVDKLRAMAEMEANLARQEAEEKANMAKLDAEFELNKMAQLKGLDAQQILAMQALQVVKASDPSQAAEIMKSIAESNAATANSNVKEEMYKQMIQNNQESTKLALESQKSATDSILRMSEKTMDTMSKVAVAASTGRKGVEKDEADEKKSKKLDCVNPNCDHKFEDKVGKFCPKCGTTQKNSSES